MIHCYFLMYTFLASSTICEGQVILFLACNLFHGKCILTYSGPPLAGIQNGILWPSDDLSGPLDDLELIFVISL